MVSETAEANDVPFLRIEDQEWLPNIAMPKEGCGRRPTMVSETIYNPGRPSWLDPSTRDWTKLGSRVVLCFGGRGSKVKAESGEITSSERATWGAFGS